MSARGLHVLPFGRYLLLLLGGPTGAPHASPDDAGTIEHAPDTVVLGAAETGVPPSPAKDAPSPAAKVSGRVHDSGSGKAHRRDLQKPYSRKVSDDARQPAAARGEVSLAAEDPIEEPKPAEEESESVSFSRTGFIPVVDFDGIPPFSDSDEIETARGLPGCVRRRTGRRVRRRAVA